MWGFGGFFMHDGLLYHSKTRLSELLSRKIYKNKVKLIQLQPAYHNMGFDTDWLLYCLKHLMLKPLIQVVLFFVHYNISVHISYLMAYEMAKLLSGLMANLNCVSIFWIESCPTVLRNMIHNSIIIMLRNLSWPFSQFPVYCLKHARCSIELNEAGNPSFFNQWLIFSRCFDSQSIDEIDWLRIHLI